MEKNAPIVDVSWLQEHAGDPTVRIVDARPLDAYLAGTIPGAAQLDVNQVRLPTSDEASIERFLAAGGEAARHAGLDGGETVVFVEEISGTLAARGVWLLDAIGHGGGAMLDGGLKAWVEAGGAIALPQEVAPGTFRESLDRPVIATADELQAGGAAGSLQIVDTRADQEWWSGTVPGATHCEWVQNLQRDGRFRPLPELKELYADLGITGDKRIATFCGSGFRAAHTYVVLKALGYDVANYAPSWGEWGRRGDLPVATPAT